MMTNPSTNHFWKRFSFAILTTALLIAPTVWISSAYATQMRLPPTQVSFGFSLRSMRTNKAEAPRSSNFVSRWLSTVKDKRTRLLWSAYPAGIRGQIFSGQEAGNDPMTEGDW